MRNVNTLVSGSETGRRSGHFRRMAALLQFYSFGLRGTLAPSQQPQRKAPPRHVDDFSRTSVIYLARKLYLERVSHMRLSPLIAGGSGSLGVQPFLGAFGLRP